MTEHFTFFLNCFVTLFSVIDPFGAAVTFLALTSDDIAEKRAGQAARSVRVTVVALVVVAFMGSAILKFFGISIQAIMISGGLILVMVSFRMLEGNALIYRSSRLEREEGEKKEDISIIPMAIPVLAGPAAITTVMVFANRANGVGDWVALFAALALSMALTHVILQKSEVMANWLGTTGLRVLTRAMGLILSAMGVEFVLSGVKGYFW
ncbi:MAG: NAAT family transporter [Nitrospinae bacterium]|nr:NAAT family transporter [Nitrospinota bacterium]